MGFGKNLQKLFGGMVGADDGPPESTTRWERAVSALHGLSQQVAKIDPDGIDVYCFPGASGGVDRYRNITDTDSVHGMVSAHDPAGPCRMAEALNMAFKSAAARSDSKPVSMLVITAGQPDDEEEVISSIKQAVAEQHGYLTITFVHVGDDPDAEAFLKHLDENLTGTSASGAEIDIVDTVKDEDLRTAMAEMRDPEFKAGMAIGALLGVLAGAAAGAGGAYMLAKRNAEKRTVGWNGRWEVLSQPGDTPTGVILDVTDDLAGGLQIDGYPEDFALGPRSSTGRYVDSEQGYAISREVADGSRSIGEGCINGCGRRPFSKFPTCCTHCKGPSGPHARDCSAKAKPKGLGESISGNVVDEHLIEWSDNTSWREVPPEGASWGVIAGAGAVGAIAGGVGGGAVGALIHKKFFNSAASKTPGDYVIIVDRSAKMALVDSGPGHS
mmetsp:Transcript_359/g.929  ORF Transcript_359/g.929 Transcript_359/m.929 type:complete len:441 (+) Transcript_359:114-1436(+)